MPPRRTRRSPPRAAVLPLKEFEGAAVAGVSFDFTKVNDALRDVILPDSAMVGDDVFVVLRGRVTEVAHRETSPDADTRLRKHHVVAQQGAFVAAIDAKLLLDAGRAPEQHSEGEDPEPETDEGTFEGDEPPE